MAISIWMAMLIIAVVVFIIATIIRGRSKSRGLEASGGFETAGAESTGGFDIWKFLQRASAVLGVIGGAIQIYQQLLG